VSLKQPLIGGAKKGHGKISRPNPIGKHIQVLQQNPSESCHDGH
jgi:muramoyltetrapeptide carboxypeptidase LdcA involved in peptidoglycan recycling